MFVCGPVGQVLINAQQKEEGSNHGFGVDFIWTCKFLKSLMCAFGMYGVYIISCFGKVVKKKKTLRFIN